MRPAAALLFVLLAAAAPARADNAIVWDEEPPPPVYVPELREAPRPVLGRPGRLPLELKLASQAVLKNLLEPHVVRADPPADCARCDNGVTQGGYPGSRKCGLM